DCLDLHGGFVGLDLGDHVTRLDRVAFFLVPLGEVALFHGGRQRGHQHLDRHYCPILPFEDRRKCKAERPKSTGESIRPKNAMSHASGFPVAIANAKKPATKQTKKAIPALVDAAARSAACP